MTLGNITMVIAAKTDDVSQIHVKGLPRAFNWFVKQMYLIKAKYLMLNGGYSHKRV